ncbi:MAG: sensor histidine kinase [Streptosporangiales bacterium]
MSLPRLDLDYHPATLHVALETAASLSALLASFLICGRLRRHARLNELVLACALAVLALTNLFFITVPTLAGRMAQGLALWATLAGGGLGALLFALAAFAPRFRLWRPGRALAVGAGAVAGVLLLTVAIGDAFGSRAWQPLNSRELPVLHSQPIAVAAQVVMAVLYGLAVAGFLRRSQRTGDEFFSWLSIAAVLAAISHIDYAIHPFLDSQWDYTAEAFRLSFYAILTVGSIREIWSYWRALSDAAVFEERRRIARDLHDGLAQELAYLARNLDSLGGTADAGLLSRMRLAVHRAQLESRQAIRTLTDPGGPVMPALDVALERAAAEIAERLQVELEFDAAPGVRLSAARAQALVRIACEAVTNAAQHSGASCVSLSLEHSGSHVRLKVSDRGCGFDTSVPGGGFGLTSMREQARSVHGELRISSAPGEGSEVEVAL